MKNCKNCPTIYSNNSTLEKCLICDSILNCVCLPNQEINMQKIEKIESPIHYKGKLNLDAIDVIESYDLNFNLGNVAKYVLRAGNKDGSPYHEDLKKALWYLQREISKCDKI